MNDELSLATARELFDRSEARTVEKFTHYLWLKNVMRLRLNELLDSLAASGLQAALWTKSFDGYTHYVRVYLEDGSEKKKKPCVSFDDFVLTPTFNNIEDTGLKESITETWKTLCHKTLSVEETAQSCPTPIFSDDDSRLVRIAHEGKTC